jgi:hypothetical protein
MQFTAQQLSSFWTDASEIIYRSRKKVKWQVLIISSAYSKVIERCFKSQFDKLAND